NPPLPSEEYREDQQQEQPQQQHAGLHPIQQQYQASHGTYQHQTDGGNGQAQQFQTSHSQNGHPGNVQMSEVASGQTSRATSEAATSRSTRGRYSLGDFIIQRTLGTGSFGRVHLVQSKHNMRFYAIKVLKKAQVVKMKQVEHTNDERRMLQKVRHPFLITL